MLQFVSVYLWQVLDAGAGDLSRFSTLKIYFSFTEQYE